jgi:hypothetical protein
MSPRIVESTACIEARRSPVRRPARTPDLPRV